MLSGVYCFAVICMDPLNWTGFPTVDLFSERNDKIIVKHIVPAHGALLVS